MATDKMEMMYADQYGKVFYWGEATVLANHPSLDVCILESKNHLLEPLPLLGNMDSVFTGDPVITMGAPHGYFPVARDGRIIALTSPPPIKWDDKELIFIGINIEPGHSGSPLMWNGKVIGVMVRYFYPEHFLEGAFATRGDNVVKFVDKHLPNRNKEIE
jgi:S1-C subfamily serine protease